MSATLCIGTPFEQDSPAFVALCESCGHERAKALAIFPDGVSFAVCPACAELAVEHSSALVSLVA